jgi:sugar/nucleoside kinase (ribokinase family)
VVVGAASRDLATDDRRGWRLGGSATYCSLAAARLGVRVGCVVGLDEEALREADEELEFLTAAGVALRPVRLEHGPVFENIERDGHRRQRWLSRSDRIAAAALPDEWASAAGWLLVPVAGEVGEEWARIPRPGARVAVGWQGMLRGFAGDGWVKRTAAEPSALLAAAGLVSASVNDLGPALALERLRALAPGAVIVLTAGDRGGMALLGQGLARYEAVAARVVVDSTGAGDVFLAALVAAWLLTGELATAGALRFAAAAGSCSVEGSGLACVPTRARVASRLRVQGS